MPLAADAERNRADRAHAQRLEMLDFAGSMV